MPTAFNLASSSGQTRVCSRSYSSIASGLMRSWKAYRGMIRVCELSVAGNGGGVSLGAFGCDALEIPALPEGVHRIFGQSLGARPFANERTHIGGEGVLQAPFCVHQRAFVLPAPQLLVINDRRF